MSEDLNYADAAADAGGEREALEWCEALVGDAYVTDREDPRRD